MLPRTESAPLQSLILLGEEPETSDHLMSSDTAGALSITGFECVCVCVCVGLGVAAVCVGRKSLNRVQVLSVLI